MLLTLEPGLAYPLLWRIFFVGVSAIFALGRRGPKLRIYYFAIRGSNAYAIGFPRLHSNYTYYIASRCWVSSILVTDHISGFYRNRGGLHYVIAVSCSFITDSFFPDLAARAPVSNIVDPCNISLTFVFGCFIWPHPWAYPECFPHVWPSDGSSPCVGLR